MLMRRAFFRGYLAGSDDERAVDVNADARGRRRIWWQLGFDAGAKEA